MEKTMKYMLICTCGNKVFTDGKELPGLIESLIAPTPQRGNGRDSVTIKPKKRFKCPKCGYIFHIVKLIPPEQKEENNKPVDDDRYGIEKPLS